MTTFAQELHIAENAPAWCGGAEVRVPEGRTDHIHEFIRLVVRDTSEAGPTLVLCEMREMETWTAAATEQGLRVACPADNLWRYPCDARLPRHAHGKLYLATHMQHAGMRDAYASYANFVWHRLVVDDAQTLEQDSIVARRSQAVSDTACTRRWMCVRKKQKRK
ncbi:hypothetical protein CYMTET_29085 [Cymbomonas tetramitiformis]|uniref:Uncharacterized protein n=1 Tax=Cymbomonas tetramitiformis TaxID=36881 RepID=A0AAE0KVK2_9CHLO|nr:hypothetical protein CYMTET_29085 [Cymbomonas tetramitiformis]|eukprot:gene12321-14550_t